MAPKWLKLIMNWLARTRATKQAPHHPSPPRRRASFPSYQPVNGQTTRPSLMRQSTKPQPQPQPQQHLAPVPPHYATLRGRPIPGKPSSAAPVNAVPPGFVWHPVQGQYVPITSGGGGVGGVNPYGTVRPFTTKSTGAATSPFGHAHLDSYRGHGYFPVGGAPGGGTGHQAQRQQQQQQQQQQYYFPSQQQPKNPMTQVPSARPVTMSGTTTTPTPMPRPQHSRQKSLPPAPPAPLPSPGRTPRLSSATHRRDLSGSGSSSSQHVTRTVPWPPVNPITTTTTQNTNQNLKVPSTPQTPMRPAPPPPGQRRSARMTRANSAPMSSMPYNASPRRVHDAYARYSSFFSSSRSPRHITFEAIPWPMVDPPKHPTSITVHAVRSFLLSPHHSSGVPARARVERAMALWEPSAFYARFGGSVREEERGDVERSLTFLQGTLRMLMGEVEAAEAMDDGSS